MDSLPKRRQSSPLAKATAKRIQEIKNGLVLQVAVKKGAFWEEVREMRDRWAVRAPTMLPPKDTDLLPELLCRSRADGTEAQVYYAHNWDRDIGRLSQWLAVPGLDRYRDEVEWRPFMSALVLFQPPLDTLQEFATFGDILSRPSEDDDGTSSDYDPMLVAPLVWNLPHPYAVEDACRDYYETLLEKINERFLKPRGLDIRELRATVLEDGSLEEDVRQCTEQVPRDFYVEISEEPSTDELRKAVEVAKAQLNVTRAVGVPSVKVSKTVLIKAELAYRRYCLNQGFLDVEERYRSNVKSAETFKAYALDGRDYLPTDS
jgi:hypothetical protein